MTAATIDLAHLDRELGCEATPLVALRRRAVEALRARGLPTSSDEAWRFTSPSEALRGGLDPAPRELTDVAAAAKAIDAALGDLASAPRLVTLNGWLVPALGRGEPPGVKLGGTLHALEAGGATVAVGRAARLEQSALVALNTAHLQDGAQVLVAAGADVAAPIVLASLLQAGAEPGSAHPRNVIVAERGARVTVVDLVLDLSPAGAAALTTNAVTEVLVGQDAIVRHVRLVLGAATTRRVEEVAVRVERGGRYEATTLHLGGKLSRSDLRVRLEAPGAETKLDGLSLAGEGEHLDAHVLLEHAAPHGTSEQLWKAIVGANGQAVFDGTVLVAKDAQKTSAQQTSRCLLLSERAAAHQNPRLEIHADDVKCSHGATVGQLDLDQLFYLRSRGLPLAEARRLLVVAFAGEVGRGLPPAVRAFAEAHVQEKLSRVAGGGTS